MSMNRAYLDAIWLDAWDEDDVVLPGTECPCGSDDVNVNNGQWTCNTCESHGRVVITATVERMTPLGSSMAAQRQALEEERRLVDERRRAAARTRRARNRKSRKASPKMAEVGSDPRFGDGSRFEDIV